jgi:mRNA-degrading endonuclease RelE of RelBE toxin-antitoxin system
MNYQIKVTPDFERSTKRIAKKYKSIYKDILHLIDQLEQNPQLGVFLGNNLYKIRIKVTSLGRGKSGGGRVITYVKVIESTVVLVEVYLKSEADAIDELIIIERLKKEGLL